VRQPSSPSPSPSPSPDSHVEQHPNHPKHHTTVAPPDADRMKTTAPTSSRSSNRDDGNPSHLIAQPTDVLNKDNDTGKSKNDFILLPNGKRLVRKVRRRPKQDQQSQQHNSLQQQQQQQQQGQQANGERKNVIPASPSKQYRTSVSSPSIRRPSLYLPESLPDLPPPPQLMANNLRYRKKSMNHTKDTNSSNESAVLSSSKPVPHPASSSSSGNNDHDHDNHHDHDHEYVTQLEPINFLSDDLPEHMTWSRRIALYLANRYVWYNPRLLYFHQQQQLHRTAHVMGVNIHHAPDGTVSSLSHQRRPQNHDDNYHIEGSNKSKSAIQQQQQQQQQPMYFRESQIEKIGASSHLIWKTNSQQSTTLTTTKMEDRGQLNHLKNQALFSSSYISPPPMSFNQKEGKPDRENSNNNTNNTEQIMRNHGATTTAELVIDAERTDDGASTIAQLRARGILDDAYPFTHARRENPSIEKAWAYFEHVVLQRYMVDSHEGRNDNDDDNNENEIAHTTSSTSQPVVDDSHSTTKNDSNRRSEGSMMMVSSHGRDAALEILSKISQQKRQKQQNKSWWYRSYRKIFRKGHIKRDRAEPGERFMPTLLYEPFWTPHSQLGDWGLGIGLYFSTLRAIAGTNEVSTTRDFWMYATFCL
jgi:hypothetical protein